MTSNDNVLGFKKIYKGLLISKSVREIIQNGCS